MYSLIKYIVSLVLLALPFAHQGLAAAAPDTQEYVLREVWRSDPDTPPFYRTLSDFVLVGDELFVLDKRSFVVSVFSIEDGHHIRDLDIHGEGPGELSSVVSMESISADTLGIFSPFGPSLVLVDADVGGPSYEYGNSRVTFSYEGERDFVHSYRCEYKGGKFYYSGKDLASEELFLARADLSSESRVMIFYSMPARSRFLGGPPVIDEGDSYIFNAKNWCVGDSGRVYFSEVRCGHGQLQIVVYEGDRKARIISHPYESRRRSEAEKKAIRNNELGGERYYRQYSAQGGIIQIDAYDPDVLDLFEYENRLWVQTSRSNEYSDGRCYDVFSPYGSFLGQHILKMDGVDWRHDQAFFLGDWIVVVKGLDQKETLHFIVTAKEETTGVSH